VQALATRRDRQQHAAGGLWDRHGRLAKPRPEAGAGAADLGLVGMNAQTELHAVAGDDV